MEQTLKLVGDEWVGGSPGSSVERRSKQLGNAKKHTDTYESNDGHEAPVASS